MTKNSSYRQDRQAGGARRLREACMKAVAVPFLAMIALGCANADDSDGQGRDDENGSSYAIGLWGDLPYSEAQEVGVIALIGDMNAQRLAFTAHDGDLKSGSSECTDAVYTKSLGYLNALKAPAMFTPGDNDWTDCDRTAGYNSLVQLDKERALFFSTPFSLGQRKLRQEVQTEALCLSAKGTFVPCVENRRWTVGRVTYATLNIQGSCNNLCDVAPDPNEYAARNHANIEWMKETFKQAKARNAVAVMLISQANPGWDLNDPNRAPLRDPKTLVEKTTAGADSSTDGFKEFLLALRDEVVAFRKPVAYVHGDSHYFRIDKPFLDAGGRRLENFTRVETFGDNQANGTNDVQWLKVSINATSREVFSYQPQIVPANRVAVPAP